MKKLCVVITFVACLTSCVKDKPHSPQYTYNYEPGSKAYIIHEGNFGSGNASLSYYHLTSKFMNHFIYRTANGGENLGDVFQSMLVLDGKMYLSINNSNEIIVCDQKSMKKLASVPVFSPRYIHQVSAYKLYISSIYTSQIYVMNTMTHSIIDTIKLPTVNTEQMAIHDGLVYVSSWDTANSSIYIIDPSSDTLIDSLDIGSKAPHALLFDKNNHLWVFSGNEEQGVKYAITVVDINSKTLLKSWTSTTDMEWIKPTINTLKDRIYWIVLDYGISSSGSGVFSMSIDDVSIPLTPFIPAQKWQYFYGLKWNPIDETLWLGDPKSFSERSEIYIYNSSGEVLDSFITQLGVGDFYFTTE